MTVPRSGLCPILLCGLLLLAGCAGRRTEPRGPAETALAEAGLYRVSVRDPVEGQRRFRLLLFAELPDRLHGEVLSPVGSVLLIIDGGAGRMAVTFVRDGVTFEGPADDAALARVLGVRLSLAALVQGLLTGVVLAPDLHLTREAGVSPALPALLVLDDGERNLTLELKRLQPLRAATGALGTGRAPAGMDVRPLSELTFYEPSDPLPAEPGP